MQEKYPHFDPFSNDIAHVREAFANVLNRHGYGFQFRIVKELHDLNFEKQSAFLFQTVEFPVEVQGSGTRIDFILKKRGEIPAPFYILAECKRANPALSDWCFVKAPYTNRKFWGQTEPVYIERIAIDGSRSAAFAIPRFYSETVHHIGLEVRSAAKGDKDGESGQAIETAASQILRGLNGYVQTIFKNPQILGSHRTANLLPVIFTTARVWSSDVDLSKANLDTGKVDLKEVGLKRVPFVFYQYHLSPGIKHGYSPQARPAEISDLIATEYIRTVPIVSWDGIGEFMKWASFDVDFDD
jgi:hypothetical protein